MLNLNASTERTRRRIGLTLVLVALIGWTWWLGSSAQAGRLGRQPWSSGLTLEERVAYQRAIEEVYWRHRIWPKENPQRKPALDEVMPLAAIRAKVEDDLHKSEALRVHWQRPITGEQLQAEMERMARQTKRPEVLKELWEALGNDPYVIAECLARPALANRLVRNWYAYDDRFHGEVKRRAEAELQAFGTTGQMRAMSGEYREWTWARGESQPAGVGTLLVDPEPRRAAPRAGEDTVVLDSVQWEQRVHELEQAFGLEKEKELDQLPVGELSRLQEEQDRFYVLAVLEKTAGQGFEAQPIVKVASVEWRKERFDAWWKKAQVEDLALRGEEIGAQVEDSALYGELRIVRGVAGPGYAYRLPFVVNPDRVEVNPKAGSLSCACEDDTWTPTFAPIVSPRSGHTAVWTGSEMIVWGSGSNTGGRYDPATDSWVATSTTNAPSPRSGHTAVWTGSEMIVWGGSGPLGGLNTGGRYDPATDCWVATSTTNAPSPRRSHTAVWTGSDMIIWGGGSGSSSNTGGRYKPATDTWEATSTVNAPFARGLHTAVWTGREMIVWGGFAGAELDTGGRYNPATDTWVATSRTNAPIARLGHTAVWTGSEMIVWGGAHRYIATDTGGRYDPATDSWVATSTANAPSPRTHHTAVWTGTEMIVWSGFPYTDTGGRYNPATNSWEATSTANAPSPRTHHTAVWTGSEMIVWGGGEYGQPTNTGGRYDPATDTWVATSATNVPSPRSEHTAVWTGTEMIVWGGGRSSVINTGGQYDPATDCWLAMSTIGAPTRRGGHTAVWTGTEMIVWGGGSYSPRTTNTGGRYNPATDTWVATSTINALSPRALHTAVWTGSEMIVWGGSYRSGRWYVWLNTGGRYDPKTDSWDATSMIDAPARRHRHTAVWTGSEMIVWGGRGIRNPLDTGGRYDPTTDTWVATSTTDAPSPRQSHTAVWTGSEMIVWSGFPFTGTGGRYDPATDSWDVTSMIDAPAPRDSHTAVWTGSEMIVWGGRASPSPFNTGGRYDPATDSWVTTNAADAPSPRSGHTAVWTGSEMIVWGGENVVDYMHLDTGGRYCAIPR